MSLFSYFGFGRKIAERHPVTYHVELDLEEDGRVIAEILEIPGALAYGSTEEEAVQKALSIALARTWVTVEQSETAPKPSKELGRLLSIDLCLPH